MSLHGRKPCSKRWSGAWSTGRWTLLFVLIVLGGYACTPTGDSRYDSSRPSSIERPAAPSGRSEGSYSSGAPWGPALGEYVVVRAVDGDTIDVRPIAGRQSGGETIRVRLIGVDTPESVDPRRPVECFGKEAAKFTASLENKVVRLEFDVERTDRYGRTLAYVYLSDGTFFNLVLVEEGYAYPYTVPPNVRHASEFVEAARRAREEKRGLWGKC